MNNQGLGRFGITLQAIVLILSTLPMLAAGQEFDPLVETLDLLQRTEQIKSAPDGMDEALPEPMVEPLLINEPQVEEKPSALESEVAKSLGDVTLEQKIEDQRVQDELPQFGYEFFNVTPTTFVPVTNLPVPPDYQVGPGDTIVVQLYGKKNVEYRLVVQRDGRLLIPEFGPLEVAGLSFQEAKEVISHQFTKGFVGTKVVVTLGELRTIHIILAGEAVQPGRYTVSGLATLFNALLNTGGIKRSGSLRNIQLKRMGHTVANFDLYDVLLRGDASDDTQLQHNDIIFTPPIGPTVGIGGEVQRPAIYELRGEATVGELIDMAGGALPTASLRDSHIERIAPSGYRTLVDLIEPDTDPGPRATGVVPGDIIRVLSVVDTLKDVVLLSGNVERPGGYQYLPGKRVSDLVPGADSLLPTTDLDFALLRREVPEEKRIAVRFVDLGRAIAGDPTSDMILRPRDELIIFSRAGDRAQSIANIVDQMERQVGGRDLAMVMEVRGHVRHAGRFPLPRDTRLSQAIKAAGGLLPGADTRYVLVARTHSETRRLSMFSVDYAGGHGGNDGDPLILPQDRIYVFDDETDRVAMITDEVDQMVTETSYGQLSPVVFVDGPVKHPGRFPYERGMTTDDLIRAAGGLNERAYGHVAELTRFVVNGLQYQEMYRERLNIADTTTDRIQVELQPYDHLTLLPKPGWTEKLRVKVTGAVKFPGEFVVQQGETFCSLIQRFGGTRHDAYPLGAVFTRESVRERQQQALDRLRSQLDDLLVQLHLSPSARNIEKMPARERNHEIIKVIKELESKKASGRMVIDFESARECGNTADIALENGDTLHVPVDSNEVNVAGQVYFPTTHQHTENKGSRYYIDLSGGSTVLGKLKHAFVVQANGEVESMRRSLGRAKNIPVSSGATIYVPLNVDRMNLTERAQSWLQSVFQFAFAAAVIL